MDEEGEEYNSTSDCDSDISVSDSENDRHEDDDGEELCEKNLFFCLSAEKYVKHRWYVRVFRVFDHWCHWALRMNITFQSQNTDNLSCIHCPWTRFGIFNRWEVIAVRSRHSFLIIMIRDLALTDLQRELSDFPRIFSLWQKKSFWRFWFDLGSYIIDRVFLKTRRISS